MQLPKNDGDLETAKLKIATFWKQLEKSMGEALGEVANTGFADTRLCAMARSEFEKGFLLVEKALRLGAPNEYAKAPLPPDVEKFKPRVDPTPTKNTAAANLTEPSREIEFREYKPDADTR